jgi:hypothetical protein
MKKKLLFVFVWLAMTALCGGSLLFAGGMFSKLTEQPSRVVAEGADVAEVQDIDYEPRFNRAAVQKASGNVYALPATPLSPESERLPPPVYAISGVKGVEIREYQPLEAVDIIVELPEKETFSRGILEGEDVSDWILNLPGGLEARAHKVKKGAASIKIYISGTPTVTARELIRVEIPGTYLTSNTARQFVSPTEEASFESWEKTQIE